MTIDANARETIQCAKCDQPNIAANEVCSHCGAHLYIFCRECGEKNPRSARRCRCGADLHRPRRRRSSRKIIRKKVRLVLLVSGFVTLGFALIYVLVLAIGGLRRLLFH